MRLIIGIETPTRYLWEKSTSLFGKLWSVFCNKVHGATSAETCGVDNVLPPDDLSYGSETQSFKHIFHIMDASLKLNHFKGHAHTRSSYCRSNILTTMTLLSCPKWF